MVRHFDANTHSSAFTQREMCVGVVPRCSVLLMIRTIALRYMIVPNIVGSFEYGMLDT